MPTNLPLPTCMCTQLRHSPTTINSSTESAPSAHPNPPTPIHAHIHTTHLLSGSSLPLPPHHFTHYVHAIRAIKVAPSVCYPSTSSFIWHPRKADTCNYNHGDDGGGGGHGVRRPPRQAESRTPARLGCQIGGSVAPITPPPSRHLTHFYVREDIHRRRRLSFQDHN